MCSWDLNFVYFVFELINLILLKFCLINVWYRVRLIVWLWVRIRCLVCCGVNCVRVGGFVVRIWLILGGMVFGNCLCVILIYEM